MKKPLTILSAVSMIFVALIFVVLFIINKSSNNVVISNNGFSYEAVIPYSYKIDKNIIESVDIKVNSDNFDELLIINPLDNQNISQDLAECDGDKAVEYAVNIYGTFPICDPNNNGIIYTMFFKVENTWHGASLTNVNVRITNLSVRNDVDKEARNILAKQIFESIRIID